MNEWLQDAVTRLGGDVELSADEQSKLLEIAAYAARESGHRVNAPLLCYLIGRIQAGRSLDEIDEALRSSSS